MVIRYLRDKLNLNKKDLYYLLGDDVVICNQQLAETYKTYMEQQLGVSITMKNSISTEQAEFARHIIKGGKNVGTVSPMLLKEIFSEYQWWKQIELCQKKIIRSFFGRD